MRDDPGTTPRSEDEVIEDMVFGLDSKLAKETRDPEWSASTEKDIAAWIETESGAAMLGAECQRTLCRVEISHESSEERERFIDRLHSASFARGGSLARAGYPMELQPL